MMWKRVRSVLLLLSLSAVSAQGGELTPPFGLSWGGSPERLVDWAKQFELNLLVKAPGKDPQLNILLITPEAGNLPNHEASMLEARFIEGKLFEVSIHYTYPGRRAEFVQSRFVELKRLLSLTYGKFKPNGRKKEIGPGIVTTSDSFHLEPNAESLLMLARTEVRDTKRGDLAARFTVIYHNERILREQRGRAPVAGTGSEPLRVPERE